MNKKGLLIVAALVAGAASAHAAHAASSYTSAGCGIGTMVMKGQKGPLFLGLAAFTNGALSNSFSITTQTMGCTTDGVVKNEKRLEVYASVNFQKISREMAQGGGEYLTGLSKLMGCKDEAQKQAFFRLAQQKYEKIIPAASTDSTAMIKNLRGEMAADPALSIL